MLIKILADPWRKPSMPVTISQMGIRFSILQLSLNPNPFFLFITGSYFKLKTKIKLIIARYTNSNHCNWQTSQYKIWNYKTNFFVFIWKYCIDKSEVYEWKNATWVKNNIVEISKKTNRIIWLVFGFFNNLENDVWSIWLWKCF